MNEDISEGIGDDDGEVGRGDDNGEVDGGYDVRAPFGGTFFVNGKSIAWTVWQGKGQGHLRFHPMHDHETWIVEQQPRLVRTTHGRNALCGKSLNVLIFILCRLCHLVCARATVVVVALKVLAVMDKIHHSLVRGKRATMAAPQDAMRDWGYMIGRNLVSVIIDEAHVCSGMLGANAFWCVCVRGLPQLGKSDWLVVVENQPAF